MPIKFTKDHFKWTNGRGLTQRPILYSQKKNTYGLGKKEHSSDQWWEKAFDNQLKNLDVSGGGASGEVTVKQTAPISTAIGMEKMAKYYIRFVKGGILEGEVEKMVKEVEEIPEDISTASEAERKLQGKKEKRAKKEKKSKRDKKRKTGAVKVESKEERRGRKRLKRLVQKELELLKIGKTFCSAKLGV
ncbi:uncharacterized protein LAJ45_05706 [Morchella importuna]|nr:uncharacterized protein LAJ45_05706 [Morchella importuna]KAH8150020.1 hypothetical protein LAJ45_05706 [Morchella importuna]